MSQRTLAYAPAAKPIILEPKAQSDTTVIFLHGLGDSGEGWRSGIEYIQATARNMKFVLPTASIRPITMNGGAPMTGIEYHSIYEQGWYDIDIQRSAKRIEEVPGLKESAEYVTMLIEKELADDKTKKVVLGGFSQGILLPCMYARCPQDRQ